jgi:hypothetical protein
MAKYGLGESSAIEDVFSDSPESVSSFMSSEERLNQFEKGKSTSKRNNLSTEKSQISIEELRNFISQAEFHITGMINEIEENLDQVNLDPNASIELEVSHSAVWKDVLKSDPESASMQQPGFICYAQYLFAEKHLCRSCRAFIKEYELIISHSTFGHLVEARKALKYILSELTILKNIAIHYLGEEYRNDTEAQISKYFADWAKTTTHYTKQIAAEITSGPVSIPNAEVDQISEKQAAQFQAFFSIKINSLTTEIQTLLSLIKRDSEDTARTFYNNYLMPALNVMSKVIEPMMFDLKTTEIGREIPTLLKEMFTAESAITGNLGAITADVVERNNQFYNRFDALLQAIRLKRRYINYLMQLEAKGTKRNKILITDAIQDIESYKETFISIEPDEGDRRSLRSSHNDLDDLDGNAHPQYLRLDGGMIVGDIDIESGIRIAGIDLANHKHDGTDGSLAIPADSIDYESARNAYYDSVFDKPYQNLVLTELNEVLLIGGNVQYEASFEIEINDDSANSYEFEILYKEI